MIATSRAELQRCTEALNDWLNTLELEDSRELDLAEHAEALSGLNALAWVGAPVGEVSRAVIRARCLGCGWAPIAVALGIPRQRVRDQFGGSSR